jgi:putative folate metabolism gamma-glutamate ligase
MQLRALKAHPIRPNEDLLSVVDRYIPKLAEQTIIAITSKIVSLCEGSVVPAKEVSSKNDLVKQHAELYLEHSEPNPYNILLTIKNKILIPSAGIDESNGDGHYILYPTDVFKSARIVWEHLRKRDSVSELGILITDSHTTPLRKGVTGVGLSWCGIKPLKKYVGSEDLFGRTLRMTYANNVDALSTAAVFVMGEGCECTPFAMISETQGVEFVMEPPTIDEQNEISISLEEDIYGPVLRSKGWKKHTAA